MDGKGGRRVRIGMNCRAYVKYLVDVGLKNDEEMDGDGRVYSIWCNQN
jgi:hypothetical protein